MTTYAKDHNRTTEQVYHLFKNNTYHAYTLLMFVNVKNELIASQNLYYMKAMHLPDSLKKPSPQRKNENEKLTKGPNP